MICKEFRKFVNTPKEFSNQDAFSSHYRSCASCMKYIDHLNEKETLSLPIEVIRAELIGNKIDMKPLIDKVTEMIRDARSKISKR